jgi:transcriptional regulator with XRE-family HTH domain
LGKLQITISRRGNLLMAKAARRKPYRLAAKLLEIRVKLGLSQNGMIRRLGLADELQQDYISKFERGVLVPPLHVLLAYAEVANVWVEVLIKDSLDLPEKLPSSIKHEGVMRSSSAGKKRRGSMRHKV